MTSNVIIALINTLILIVAIPLIGIAIDYLNKIILGFIQNIFGRKIAYIFANRITFIGTVHHELAHALFAIITGAKIIKIKRSKYLVKKENFSFIMEKIVAQNVYFFHKKQNYKKRREI